MRSYWYLAGSALLMQSGLTVFAPPVAAQDTVQVQEIVVEVARPTTTTGGTSAVELSLDSAATVAAPTMEEFLRQMPLIQIRTNSRGEAQPNLRGAEDRQVAILLDGIPLTVGWDHRTDLAIIPLTAVRNVTLLRGLSSMLHGPNVLGGALEFDVARAPNRGPTEGRVSGAMSIDQEGGVGASASASTYFEGDNANWLFRAGSGYRERPGVPVADYSAEDTDTEFGLRQEFLVDNNGLRLNSDRRQTDSFLAARYLRSGGAWASGLLSTFEVERGVPPEAHVSEPRLWRYPEQTRLLVIASGGTGKRTTRSGEGELEFSFGVDRAATTIEDYRTYEFAEIQDRENNETTTLTGRLLGDHAFDAFGEVRSSFTLVDVRHSEEFQDGRKYSYEQRLWSLGAEIEVGSGHILGGPTPGQTLWTLGASVDGANTPLSGDKEPLGTMWDWGIRGGVTRSAAEGRALYHVGLGRRTRFPSLRELYSGALGRFEPNPLLQPEQLISAEAGLTLARDGTRIQVVAFHHHLSNGIVRTRSVTSEGSLFKRVNRDEVVSSGLELLLSVEGRTMTYGGDLTLQQVRIVDPAFADGGASWAEYEPAIAGSLNLAANGPWGVGLAWSMRFRGSQFCENVEVGGMQELVASAMVDVETRRVFLMRDKGFLRHIDGAVGLANATDTVVMDQCGLPQPGRTLRIQVNVR